MELSKRRVPAVLAGSARPPRLVMGEGLLFLGLQLLLLSCELDDTNTAWHLLEPGTEPVVGPRQEQKTVGESTTTVCCRPWSPA